MRLISYNIPADCDIVLFGDTHEGSLLKYYKGVQKCLSFILAEKNRYAIHMGDIAECITHDDPRYDPTTIKQDIPTPLEQYLSATKELMPIKERLIGIHHGNHDDKLRRKIGNAVEKIVCTELKTNYLTFASVITFLNQKGHLLFRLYCNHGFGRCYSYADDITTAKHNMAKQLKRKLKFKIGDCLIEAMGHTHLLQKLDPDPTLYLSSKDNELTQKYTHAGAEGDYIPPDHRYFINTGSFYKSYQENLNSYAEIMGYDPVPLGYAVIEIRDKKVNNVKLVTV